MVSRTLFFASSPLTTSPVPFCGTIKNGETVKIECLDWTGGQIKDNDSADDVKNVDLTQIHYLSGPFEIETAEPGDVLLVEIQDVQPFQDHPWGFTGVFHKDNGGGFLDEIYPEAYVTIHNALGPVCRLVHVHNTDRTPPYLVPKPSGISKAYSARPVTFLASVSPVSSTQVSWAAHHLTRSSPSGTGGKPNSSRPRRCRESSPNHLSQPMCTPALRTKRPKSASARKEPGLSQVVLSTAGTVTSRISRAAAKSTCRCMSRGPNSQWATCISLVCLPSFPFFSCCAVPPRTRWPTSFIC